METYRAGASAYAAGEYKDAIDAFLQADAVIQNPSFAFNISLAYEQMGDRSLALRWAREYLRRSPDAPERADTERRIASFEAHLRERGVMQVTVVTSPPGATVSVDGRSVGLSPWTGDVTMGDHWIRLDHPQHREHEQQLSVGAHASTIEVTLRSAPPAAESSSPPSSPSPTADLSDANHTRVSSPMAPTDGEPTFGPLLPIGLAVGGVGLVGLGVSAGLEAARANAERSARDAVVQLDAAHHAGRMETFELAARVTLGVGAGLAVLGAVLSTVELASADDDGSHASLELGCSAAACGVGGAF
ncbi:MAG: PEGA domain-containing protein [Polyangiaceae bacterium]